MLSTKGLGAEYYAGVVFSVMSWIKNTEKLEVGLKKNQWRQMT